MSDEATPVRRKPPNAGKGRVKGVPNKSTANARAAIGAFVDKNAQRLQRLLDEIEADEGAQAAWNCIMDLIEYHVPKLGRTEHVGEDGGPLQVTIADPRRKGVV